MQPFTTMPQPRGNQFVTDFSGSDFSDQMGPVTANGSMTIQFFYAHVRIEDPMDPSQNGTYKTRLCVRKRPHGDRLTEAVRFISEAQAMQLYPREFAYFKQNQDVPTNGTPLSELPGITQSQIAILVIHNVRCIEDLVGLSVDQVGQIGMDARAAHALAARWTDSKTANGDLIRDAAADAAMKAENDQLRADRMAMSQAMAEMKAQLDLLTRMGLQGGQAAVTGQGPAAPVLVDADGMGEDAPASEMFVGARIVTGNDDLNDDAPTPGLPGLDRKRK